MILLVLGMSIIGIIILYYLAKKFTGKRLIKIYLSLAFIYISFAILAASFMVLTDAHNRNILESLANVIKLAFAGVFFLSPTLIPLSWLAWYIEKTTRPTLPASDRF